jgi:hypothetical protein
MLLVAAIPENKTGEEDPEDKEPEFITTDELQKWFPD